MGKQLGKEICLSIYNKAITAPILIEKDLNELIENQNAFVHNGCINTPLSGVWWYVEVVKFVDSRYILQRATSPDYNSSVYVRCRLDGSWKPWVKI